MRGNTALHHGDRPSPRKARLPLCLQRGPISPAGRNAIRLQLDKIMLKAEGADVTALGTHSLRVYQFPKPRVSKDCYTKRERQEQSGRNISMGLPELHSGGRIAEKSFTPGTKKTEMTLYLKRDSSS